MTPRISDPVLRAHLIDWFEERAQLWQAQGDASTNREDAHRCHLVADALIQMGRDLDDEIRLVYTGPRRMDSGHDRTH